MTNRERKKNKRLGKMFVLLGFIILCFAVYVNFSVRPLIERISEYRCKVAAVRVINDAVLAELNGGAYNYDNIINLNYSAESGEIKSITSDMNIINRLKSRSALIINEAVGGLSAMDIGISLGTVSGVSVLYGRGPDIPARVVPKGYANCVLISEFVSAGINQTLHRIIMEVEVDMTVILPGFNKTIGVQTNYVVAETIIIGEVPNMYVQVSGAGELFKGLETA